MMVYRTSSAAAGSFEPGYMFARRYRLVHRLRSSRVTDVWRADDLILASPVALEVVHSADDRERQDVLQQIRLVRALAHRSVCRVLDAGEADGRIYASLELVDGENLRTVLRRAGRLPSEKVADIGRQLCEGLAALQAVKLRTAIDPWRVLLDAAGSVRIGDLGLGLTPDDVAVASPAAAGAAAARVASYGATPWASPDAYAVGALLYELLVGSSPEEAQRGHPATPRPSALVPNVDARLERVILEALAQDPVRRPASAAAMAMALSPLPVSDRQDWWRWVVATVAVAAVIGLFALVAEWLLPNPPAALSQHDAIVLADLTNTTGNPVFDGALRVALAVALEQSPFLRVYPDARARETLRLMQRAPDERITADLARDIARRQQLKALVAGSIGMNGERYVLTLDAIEASTGAVIAQESIESASADEILTALGTAAARLRARLGESLASIQRFDTPLPQATTPSLEALREFALAQERGQLVLRAEAIPHLERAIALDSGFAMAHAALSGVYRNTDRSADAPRFSRRAFELRDRVSERERFFISWRYYLDAAQAWDKALEVSVSWTNTYPGEPFAFNSLGLASASLGDHEQAIRAFQEAIRLDPGFVPPHGNLTGSLMALNRFTEARSQLQDAKERGIAFITVSRMRYLLAFIENDRAAMTREIALLRTTTDAAWADIWEAWAAAFAGEWRDAHDLYQRGVEAALRTDAREVAALSAMEDAELHAIAGECDTARSEVPAGLALSRDNFTLERAARTLALCGDSAAVTRLTDELRERFPEATLTARIQLPVIAAVEALRAASPARVIALLDPVTPYDHAPAAEFWPAYLRGEAYLQLKDGAAAEAQFRAIVDRRGQAPASPLYLLATRKLATARALPRSSEP